MVWSEPTGIDVLIPGDKDTSNPSDTRDYILLTGMLPDEVSTFYDTAIVFFNGKFDAAKSGKQIKYFLIGSKDNVLQHAVGVVTNGVLTFTALSGESVNLSTTPPLATSVLGRVNNDPAQASLPGVQFANIVQAPITDFFHGNRVYPPNYNYGSNGVLYKILGTLQNNWTADVATFREDVGIYRDATGRCHLQGSIYRSAGAVDGVCIDIAFKGPWAPVQFKERVFACMMQDSNGIRACNGIVRCVKDTSADIFLQFPSPVSGAVRVSLTGINWHTTASLLT